MKVMGGKEDKMKPEKCFYWNNLTPKPCLMFKKDSDCPDNCEIGGKGDKMKPKDCKAIICIMTRAVDGSMAGLKYGFDDCPETCPIVKLNKRVDEQQAEIRNLQQPNVIAEEVVEKYVDLKNEIAALKEGEDCPGCGNRGQYENSIVKCDWCHDNPMSKFNRARWKK
jgi:hypothetical protein